MMMTTTLNDHVFGDLSRYQFGWTRKYDISIFGENKQVVLRVETSTEPSPEQQETFSKFNQNKKPCVEEIEKSIFEYYSFILEEKRDDLEDQAEEIMPIISSINELRTMVSLDKIIIRSQISIFAQTIGFLFDCTWEPDDGLGVVLTDNKVTGVDTQDIVL